jgi:peptidoglycan/LPS O-acetylase OafA/YrhL
MNEQPTTRYDWIDGTRGIAVLSVVIAHSACVVVCNDITYAFGRFGVALFFILSGYVIAQSVHRHSPASFWWRRALRLLPALWFSMLLYIMTGLSVPEVTPQILLLNATMLAGPWRELSISFVYWTLTAELVWYILASLGFARRVFWLPLIALPLIFLLPDGHKIAGLLPLFGIGAAFAIGKHRTLMLAASIPFAWLSTGVGYDGELYGYLLALPVFLLAWRWQFRWPRSILWVGKISYSVYLLHMLPIHLLPYRIPAAELAIVPVHIILALGLSWVAYLIAERPFLRHATRRNQSNA